MIKKIVKKLIVLIERLIGRRYNNVILYGLLKKNIDKTCVIDTVSLLFNCDWNQKRLLSKREYGKLELKRNSFLSSGDNCVFRSGCSLTVFEHGKLTLGSNVSFNNNCEVYVEKEIIIGNETIFGPNCVLRDSDMHKYGGTRMGITIGNKCWIGTNTIILKGVHIGDGCIIGAGSVVTRDIPPHSVACGNPARVIKNDISWER